MLKMICLMESACLVIAFTQQLKKDSTATTARLEYGMTILIQAGLEWQNMPLLKDKYMTIDLLPAV